MIGFAEQHQTRFEFGFISCTFSKRASLSKPHRNPTAKNRFTILCTGCTLRTSLALPRILRDRTCTRCISSATTETDEGRKKVLAKEGKGIVRGDFEREGLRTCATTLSHQSQQTAAHADSHDLI